MAIVVGAALSIGYIISENRDGEQAISVEPEAEQLVGVYTDRSSTSETEDVDSGSQRPPPSAQYIPPNPDVGVMIRSEPAYAQVLIDGEVAGYTPIRKYLEPGKHRVKIQKLGYQPIGGMIKVDDDADNTFDYILNK